MDRLLEGVRVVDFSHYLAGPAVAMLLSDLGADVVRVDPPTGSRWGSPAEAMLQRGKRSIALDLRSEEDRDVAQRLVRRADIVIESFRPGVAERLGIGPRWSREVNPRLVYLSIPGFGETDPRASVQAWEGVICAAAGIYVSRTADPSGPPAFNAIPYASSFGTMVAAHSLMAALIVRERTGVGQRVEAPLFDALFEAIGHFGLRKVGKAPGMQPNVFGAIVGSSPQGGFYRCADGRWIHLCLIQWRHLEWFAERFFPEEWLSDGMADPQRMGAADADAELFMRSDSELHARARARLAELFATKPAAEWEEIINEEIHAPTAACFTTEEWLNGDVHARESRAVIVLDDPLLGPTPQAGYPIAMSKAPLQAQGPRRPLDCDREAILDALAELEQRPLAAAPTNTDLSAELSREGALEGVRVVDTSQVLAGPTATRILAQYGADVVKVMSPKDGQILAHTYTNSGKKSIMVDLKTERGREIFFGLARNADVIQENFSLGTAERMGIGEEEIRAVNPDVVYSWVSTYGSPGPRARWRGREELGQAVTGMQLRWGGEDGPRMQPFALNDYGAGNWSAFAIMAALLHRWRGGGGQRVEASLAQTCTFHQLPFMVSPAGHERQEPSGQLAVGSGPLDRLYQTSDGWIYVAVGGSERRERLRALPAFADVDLDDEQSIEMLLATASSAEWVQLFQAADVGAHAVLDVEGVMEDAATRERGLSYEAPVPVVGLTRLVGPSSRLSLTPVRHRQPPGPVGYDCREVLARIGLARDFGDLVRDRIVYPELPEDVVLVGRFRAAA